MNGERKLLQQQLQAELKATAVLLADSKDRSKIGRVPATLKDLYGSRSFLEICAEVREQAAAPLSEPIRTLHHFASTGGTLFAKLIAALPNVFVLSEVHPHSRHSPPAKKFAPSDISLLCRAADLPEVSDLSERLFVDSLLSAHEWTTRRGGRLILRDHTHSDFCIPASAGESLLLKLIGPQCNRVIPVVTVRHPADSFASAKMNKFFYDHEAKAPYDISFGTYCDRYNQFLDAVDAQLVVKYEDLISDPAATLSQICDVWSLEYDEMALEIFSQFQFSGDSGRSSDVIADRPPRPESEQYRQSDADSYVRLISRLGYSLRR